MAPRTSIRIVPVSLGHVDAIQEHAADPLVGEMTVVPHPYPPGAALAFVKDAIGKRAAGTEAVWAIEEDGSFRGLVGTRISTRPLRHGELGYWLGAPFRGRGIATAAARLAVEASFLELGLPLLLSSCLERNPASARVLEKSGFTRAGEHHNENPKWPPAEPFRAYVLTRWGWEARRRRERVLSLRVEEGRWAICRLAPDERVPAWADAPPFACVTRTPDELSVLCPEGRVPAGVLAERGWRLLGLKGPFGFGETGILASLLDPLAAAGVGILALSTYDTDWLLVKEDRLEEALAALRGAGHAVEERRP